MPSYVRPVRPRTRRCASSAERLWFLRVWRVFVGARRFLILGGVCRPSELNGGAPDSPRNPGEGASSPEPRPPVPLGGRVRPLCGLTALRARRAMRRTATRAAGLASGGGFRGESGGSGYGRKPNATAFGPHEGLHLEERRPECRGRYHPASWRPRLTPDEYAPYPSLLGWLLALFRFASTSARAFGPGR